MIALGYDPDYTSTTDDHPAALGNRIAATVLATGLTDGSNEADNYADPTYTPVNEPLVVKLPGTTMADPNRWQPLALDVQIGQNGIPIPGKVQVYVGSQWLGVTPFALHLTPPSPLYLDPGPPPRLAGAGDQLFKDSIVHMLELESQLTPDDGVRIDISPASWGNNPLGTNDGHGYPLNPVTGAPYTPQVVRRGDFARVLAEFWADGPTSETPPGHWNVLANSVSDDQRLEHRIGGTGPIVDRLEWDVKLALALNGATHDAAIQCWGVKRFYDSVRPISMVRYMGGLGQSSDPTGTSYHPSGLPLVPGLIEVVTPRSSARGQRHADFADHVGEVVVFSWPGEPRDPTTQYTGVRWVRAVDWVPYQRKTFVTPPFAAFPSGHSTYSRAAAELLTRFTGSEYFPGGLGHVRGSAERLPEVRDRSGGVAAAGVGALLRRGRPGRYLAPVRRHPHDLRRLPGPHRRLHDRRAGLREGHRHLRRVGRTVIGRAARRPSISGARGGRPEPGDRGRGCRRPRERRARPPACRRPLGRCDGDAAGRGRRRPWCSAPPLTPPSDPTDR